MGIIDLEKRAEKVRIILEKKNIRHAPTVRVSLAMDISGSTRPLYRDGTVQQTVERLLAIAMRFDDNGEMDMWAFSNAFQRLAAASKDDFEGYVQREILDNDEVEKWGGTSYAPVANDILNFYFRGTTETITVEGGGFFGALFGKTKTQTRTTPAENAAMPAMNLFITDGANDDREETERVLRLAKDYPMYWQMVGVGKPSEFKFLQRMANDLPNVGFLHLNDLSISDDELYERLLSDELCNWVKSR